MDNTSTRVWQILDTGSVWMKEFAYALAKMEKVVAWSRRMETFGIYRSPQKTRILDDPHVRTVSFPLQRGYARAPLRWIAPFERKVVEMLRSQTEDAEKSPLVCSTPFYAPVAELWPGPVIYYVTDLTVAYPGLDPRQVRSLDRRLCRAAWAVCPNSRRIADYLMNDAGCLPGKITVVPNATRESNVQKSPQYGPGMLPKDVEDLPRPIVGVLGNLEANMDWELIADAIRQTPGFSWLFIGPYDGAVRDAKQDAARAWAIDHARFVGRKPYGELQSYARCLDVAVLPYRKVEPTFSGSSTRFYEHLAAGRPMLATRGFAELLEKEPLLKLVDTAEEIAESLAELRANEFRDGHEATRWKMSKKGTWEERARAMRRVLGAEATEMEQSLADLALVGAIPSMTPKHKSS